VRRVLVLVLSALLLSLLPGLAAQAETPAGGATFNKPRPYGTTAERWRIVRKVNSAVKSVPGWKPTSSAPQPRILIAAYFFDQMSSADALIAACKRGVSVRVVLDGKVANRAARKLVTALNGDNVRDANGNGIQDPGERPTRGKCNRELSGSGVARSTEGTLDGSTTGDGDGLLSAEAAERSVMRAADEPFQWGPDRSYVKKCEGTCRGGSTGQANMHSKFYAFSQSGTAKNVIMVSSSNLNAGGALNGWNDMYTMRGRPAGFQCYNEIHRELTADKNVANGQRRECIDGPFTSRFFPMKGAGQSNDPLMVDLRKIGCRSAFGPTQIRVSMFYWADSRGDYIADKLLSLARSGCKVHIIYGAPGNKLAARLRQAAHSGLIRLWDSRRGLNAEGTPQVRTHGKFVLVKGSYAGNGSAHVVMTGTQNWVWGSLTNSDENSLNIHLKSAYDQYARGWEVIRRHSDWID
jgi:phosphatidylserine/phosphatidylglycerophosphate/cardiolipin synthase-like enzyme